jgi:hypothetical protein
VHRRRDAANRLRRLRWLRSNGLAARVVISISGVVVAAVVGWRFCRAPAGPSGTTSSERGVSLGMSEAQVRSSFIDARAGDWTRTTACGGPSLEWTRATAGVPTRWARFELHDGWVAAIRIHEDGQGHIPRVEQTPSAIRRDRLYQGGIATTIIARGPAVYAAEVDQISRLAIVGSSDAGR